MWPTNIEHWAMLIVAVLTILVILYGAAVKMVRHQSKQEFEVAIIKALEPIQLQLRTMNGELGRVRIIESKIENGLTAGQIRLAEDVKELRGDFKSLLKHLAWDGSERRISGDT